MASLNKVFLIGNLTKDPELRYTPSGTALADLRLAVNRSWTSQDGQRQEETVFVDVTLWARQAEVACEYLRKGSPILIEGRLRYDQWTDKEGQKRSRLTVVGERMQFLGSRGERDQAAQPSAQAKAREAPAAAAAAPAPGPPPPDQIPF